MPRTKITPRRIEGVATLAAAPRPNNGPSCGAGASVEAPLIKQKKEEETLGRLRDRLGLVPGLARVPGPRAVFVHIKVEDSTSGQVTDGEEGGGEGDEATGGEGDGGRKKRRRRRRR
jgi:hypothetical protein